jgi:hypothetical protein
MVVHRAAGFQDADRWDPYEWYWAAAVEAVKHRVPLLEQE